MRKAVILVAALVAVFCRPVSAEAGDPNDILVIVNASLKLKSVSESDLRDIFLKKRTSWKSGVKAVPIHSKNARLRGDFLGRLLSMSASEEARYWQKQQIRSGDSPPASFGNTLEAVYRLKGAVSYVYRSDYRGGVATVVLTLPAP
jgi:hypothetical protein